MKPDEIERLSFEIIDREAGRHDFPPEQWKIVRRIIHTSADFEYIKSIRFHPDAVRAGVDAIRRGSSIVTDTRMAQAGIRKKEIARFGGSVACLISDPDVGRAALAAEGTRAEAAVDAALSLMENGIYAVGNAPTALFRLIEWIKEDRAGPALIIGLPVGFVNAAESKAALRKTDVPFITNLGRKGGSNVAAAAVNALAILAAEGAE